MFIIEAEGIDGRKWIAGIFRETAAAADYFQASQAGFPRYKTPGFLEFLDVVRLSFEASAAMHHRNTLEEIVFPTLEALASQVAPVGTFRLYEIPFAAYPVHLFASKGFRFVDCATLRSILDSLPTPEKEDDHLPVIYRIEEDFFCENPGADYMGVLEHIHLDRDFLLQYRDWPKEGDPFDLDEQLNPNRVNSERVSKFVVEALVKAGLVAQERAAEAVEVATNVVELRDFLGD